MQKAKYNYGLLETPASNELLGASGGDGTSRAGKSFRLSSSTPYSSRQSSTSSTGDFLTSSSWLKTPQSTGAVGRRLQTPASRPTPHSATPAAHHHTAYIVSLVEGRGQARGEIGMAAIDLMNPVLSLYQFPDSQTYGKTMNRIQILQPKEVIMPSTACEGGKKTKLLEFISDEFHGINIAVVPRKYFNENRGLQYVKQLSVSEFNAVLLEVTSKYYCLAAVAALLKYVEHSQNSVYASNSLKIEFKGSEHTVMIDGSTARHLELVINCLNPSSTHSLYGILNSTKTPAGARLLRSNILQPPCDLETINLRLGCVTKLTEEEEVFYALQAVLGRFLDTDSILSQAVQIPKQETLKTAESRIATVISLKHTLELVDPLKDSLKDCSHQLLQAYHTTLNDKRFGELLEKLKTVVNDDTQYQKGTLHMKNQKCFCVKPGINGLLDVARRTYTETVEDIVELARQLSEKHSLPLKSSFNNSRGFFLQLSGGKGSGQNLAAEKLPSEFVKLTKARNTLSFTTLDLIKLNDRLNSSLNEVYLMTSIVLKELLSDVREYMGCLYKLTECVGMLDMLVSFAHYCTLGDYVCPEFTDTLAIKQGRHPILEKISTKPIVPNNTYASEGSNFVILTGANMSGKSTFLKQVALLQIMAQIGSYVPADYASFRIATQIFSRIGSEDDLESNASSFMLEMREINNIVQNADEKSLIVIDELGRATGTEEAMGICYAICEHLIELKAFTFFATHFQDMSINLAIQYPNVDNYHFEVKTYLTEDNHEKLQYSHVLSRGPCQLKHYGLKLAEACNLPEEVLKDAKEIAEKCEENQLRDEEEVSRIAKERAVFKLVDQLRQVSLYRRQDEDGLRVYLKHLKKQFLEECGGDVSFLQE